MNNRTVATMDFIFRSYCKIDCCENCYCPISTQVCISEKTTKNRGCLWYPQEIVHCICWTGKRPMHDIEHKGHHVNWKTEISHSLCHFIPWKRNNQAYHLIFIFERCLEQDLMEIVNYTSTILKIKTFSLWKIKIKPQKCVGLSWMKDMLAQIPNNHKSTIQYS